MASREAIDKETGKAKGKPRLSASLIEEQMARIVIDQEYHVARRNSEEKGRDLQDAVDMLECVRKGSKKEDWQSDIHIPEFASISLTLSGIQASQYFQRRDFVETYLEDDSEDAMLSAAAAERCLNRTLNQRHLFYYQKFMRASQLSNLGGEVFLKCWWEQRTRKVLTGYETIQEETGVDIYGYEIASPEQIPAYRESEVPVYEEEIEVDRFQFDVLDPRNVFVSTNYAYTLQDKDWVIVREEKTLAELEAEADIMGYSNLGKLRGKIVNATSEVAEETYEKDEPKEHPQTGLFERFEVLWRWGKWPCIVVERDEDGEPVKIRSAIDALGNIEENAEWLETVIVFAKSGNIRQLLRLDVNPYGFRPIIRGLCYIHPTKDGGLGDGKLARELQDALNETLNISNDRVLLATFPTMAVRMYSYNDLNDLVFEPGRPLLFENPDDVHEFQISDNIQGALAQAAMFRDGLHKLMAVYPTTMGKLPEYSSTTATAVVEAGRQADTRGNYRALTAEYTWLTELYWMILKMTDMFAMPETREMLMGDLAEYLDPDLDYYFKPVSQAIETEYSKRAKVRELTSVLQLIASFPNPQTPKVINKILKMIFELQGHELSAIGELLDENVPPPMEGMGASSPSLGGAPPEISNQYGIPTGGAEQYARAGTYE